MSQQPNQVHREETLEDALNRVDATNNGQSVYMKYLQDRQAELDNVKRDYETKKAAIEVESQSKLNKINGRQKKIRRRTVICMMCIYIVFVLAAMVIAALSGLPELAAHYNESGEPGAFGECFVVMLIFYGPLLILGIYIGLHTLDYSPILTLLVFIASPIWTAICTCFAADDHSSPDTIDFVWNSALLPVCVALGVFFVAIIVVFFVNVCTGRSNGDLDLSGEKKLAALEKEYVKTSVQLKKEVVRCEHESNMPVQFTFEGTDVSNRPQDVIHELQILKRAVELLAEARDIVSEGVEMLEALRNKRNELKDKLEDCSDDRVAYNKAAKKQEKNIIAVKAAKKVFPVAIFLTLVTIASFIIPAKVIIPLAFEHTRYSLFLSAMAIAYIAIIFESVNKAIPPKITPVLKRKNNESSEKDSAKGDKKPEIVEVEVDFGEFSLFRSVLKLGLIGILYYLGNMVLFGKSTFWISLIPLGMYVLSKLIELSIFDKVSRDIKSDHNAIDNINAQVKDMISPFFEDNSTEDLKYELFVLESTITAREKERGLLQNNLKAIQKALDSVGVLPDYYQKTGIIDRVLELAKKKHCATINEALILYEEMLIDQTQRECEVFKESSKKALEDIKRYEKDNNVYDSFKEHERKINAGNFQSQYEGYCYKYDSLQKELDNLARSKGIDPNEL